MSRGTQTREDAAGLTAEAVLGEQLLTTRNVAAIFGTAESTIREWINRGEIQAIRFGKLYYISTTALRESKEAKEDEARAEADRRRRAAAMAQELAERQQLDPALAWQSTVCIACGIQQVLSTRNERLDGHVLCASCLTDERRTKPHPYGPRTKDEWERRVAIAVAQLNAETAPLRPTRPQGTPQPQYIHEHCPICGAPYVHDVSAVSPSGAFGKPHPCAHPAPFGSVGQKDQTRDDESWRFKRQYARLHVATQNRLGGYTEEDVDAWALYECVGCGCFSAAAQRHTALAGLAVCADCLWSLLTSEPSPSNRAESIVNALGLSHASTRRCACGQLEVVGKDNEPLLSWCAERPEAERVALARAHIERHALPPTVAERLLSQMRAPSRSAS